MKRDDTIKVRGCKNGNVQRYCVSKEETSRTIVAAGTTLTTEAIEVKHKRDSMTIDMSSTLV